MLLQLNLSTFNPSNNTKGQRGLAGEFSIALLWSTFDAVTVKLTLGYCAVSLGVRRHVAMDAKWRKAQVCALTVFVPCSVRPLLVYPVSVNWSTFAYLYLIPCWEVNTNLVNYEAYIALMRPMVKSLSDRSSWLIIDNQLSSSIPSLMKHNNAAC